MLGWKSLFSLWTAVRRDLSQERAFSDLSTTSLKNSSGLCHHLAVTVCVLACSYRDRTYCINSSTDPLLPYTNLWESLDFDVSNPKMFWRPSLMLKVESFL